MGGIILNIERNHIPLFLSFRISDNENDWKYIRTAVFIEEQGFINEFDDIDHSAVHLCAYLNDTAVGCLRFSRKEMMHPCGIWVGSLCYPITGIKKSQQLCSHRQNKQ